MSRRGGVIVVKYGGSAMEDPTKVSEILQEIAGLAKEGFPVVLVHGGGKEISGEMDRKGLKAVFAQGFRVTDEAAMAVVEEVELGGKSRGISGRKVFHAKKAAKAGGVDLGRVGEVERCEIGEVKRCLDTGETAVVSPVGQGNDGGAMNLNADVAAAALAGALQAEQMIFLSDVPGLMKDVKDPGSLIREIRAGELAKLEKEGVIGGGMIPKCRSAASTKVVKGQERAGTTLTA
ncbi:MAG: acetylglutamate kinase [Verrucomicrobia bacterium]|nr:acetylglutamate kinase [Verrucomicrobiota bacterium]